MRKFFNSFLSRFSDRQIYLSIVLGITTAVFLNQLIDLLKLKTIFTSYTDNIQGGMFMYPLLTGIIIYGILTPLGEEIAFRFILFGRLRLYMATGAAAVFSSIIFGIYHGNFIQFVYAFCFGILLSFLYWRFESLIAPIFAHSAANILVYSTASAGGIGVLSTLYGQLISLIISGILTFAIIKKIYQNRPKKKKLNRRLPIFPQR